MPILAMSLVDSRTLEQLIEDVLGYLGLDETSCANELGE